MANLKVRVIGMSQDSRLERMKINMEHLRQCRLELRNTRLESYCYRNLLIWPTQLTNSL
jgi:hypothetical protein